MERMQVAAVAVVTLAAVAVRPQPTTTNGVGSISQVVVVVDLRISII
jgi:hypothetical protein